MELLLLLTPVFWALGLEQFVAVPVLGWAALKSVLRTGRLRFDRAAGALLALLAAMVISASAIDVPLRYLSFVRNTSMYLAGLLCFFIVRNEVDSWEQVRRLLRAVVLMMGVASLLGLAGLLGLHGLRFGSLAGLLMPDAISATDYGRQVAVRSIGRLTWFSGFGQYFRVNSLFLYATMYAAALVVTIPVAAFFATEGRLRSRLLYGAVTLTMVVNLVFTTGRTAWLSIGVAAVVTLLSAPSRFLRLTRGLVLAAGAVALLLVVPLEDLGQGVENVLYARGSGSTVSRTTIYAHTLQGFLERPFFGWGTERDIEDMDGFKYPAGSHSWYLGILYRHGAVGLALLVILLAIIWSGSRPPSTLLARSGPPSAPSIVRYLRFSRWALLGIGLNALTSALDLDATLMICTWTVAAAGLSARRLSTHLVAGGAGGA